MSSYKKFILGEQLTGEQQLFFDQHGFIHFKNFISAETVNSIIEASKQVQQQWLSNGVDKVNGVPIKYGKDLDGSDIVQRFAFINQQHDLF